MDWKGTTGESGMSDVAQDTGEGRRITGLLDNLAAFAHVLAAGSPIADVFHDLAERVTHLLGVRGCGVSLLQAGRLTFVNAHNEDLVHLERIQEETQVGPCVSAARSGEYVIVENLTAHTDTWPDYVARAVPSGINAIASLPIRGGGEVLGTLTVYGSGRHEWLHEELEVARVFADLAAGYLLGASKLDQQRRLAEQLQEALDSRIVIEQAKGMIAASRNVSIDEAFKILRKHANDHHAGLHVTAEAVVNLGLRP